MMAINATRVTSGWALAMGLAGAVFAQDNQLTPAETDAGYDLLFNGTDLNNWHAYRRTSVTDAWTVKTNAPLGPRIENGNGTKEAILTNKQFKNFDLKIDVQTTANGNSGVFTRYEETALSSANARSGPECQVCGPSHPDCISQKNTFGASYDMFPVASNLRTTWYNPPGSWNQLRIIAFDSNYVHYGNGKKLLEYKIGTQEYMAAYNQSKYVSDGNNGRYYHIHPGGILLQHHGETGITFRNIKAKELDVHPFKREFMNGQWPDTLGQGFVFGAPPVSAVAAASRPAFGLTLERLSAGNLVLRIGDAHSGFEAFGLDGKPMAFRKLADGAYALTEAGKASSVAVVRIRRDGETVSRLVPIP